jgi:hypothetical protein
MLFLIFVFYVLLLNRSSRLYTKPLISLRLSDRMFMLNSHKYTTVKIYYVTENTSIFIALQWLSTICNCNH